MFFSPTWHRYTYAVFLSIRTLRAPCTHLRRFSTMPKLLLIDDDIELSNVLKDELVKALWAVELAHNGRDGLQLLQNFEYDLVVLDWQMPDLNGLEVLAQYRKGGGNTPVIFLTGEQSVESKEKGLDCGADDYLTKPFDVREFMARIRSLYRRPRELMQGSLNMHGAELSIKTKRLLWQDKEIKLSTTECSILEFLMRHPDHLFSGAELFKRVWPSDTDAREDTVRVHMHVLRRKLKLAGAPELVKTVKGSGYILKS